MKSQFEMSMMGELNYFLGLKVKQMDKWIFISQFKYARDLIKKKFDLENAKHARTPMSTSIKLSKDVNQTLYRSMIGSLLYLTTSKLDITFSVGICDHFQACSKESHLFSMKRIIKYVNEILGYGIWFTLDTNTNIAEYTNAYWTGSSNDRKSTSGWCFYVGNNLVAQ